MKKSNEKQSKKEGAPKRIRFVTVLGVEYTVGPPHGDSMPTEDGRQLVSEHDIADAITSEECMILTKMMQDVFIKFREKYPNTRAAAMLYPAHGVPGVDAIDLGGND